MKLTEFKKKMIILRTKHYKNESYLCFDLRDTFNNNEYYVGIKHDKSCELLRRVFKGKRESAEHGLFGTSQLKENKETRKVALEFFEAVVIDEKWYKEL